MDALKCGDYISTFLTSVPRPLGIGKIRKFICIPELSKLTIKPFNHSFHNLTRAVCERVFYVKMGDKFTRPPQPVDFAVKLERVKRQLMPFLPRIVPWTEEQFLDSCNGPKRKRYEAAAESLREEDLGKRDARVEVFIKYEKTDHTTKQDPVPRVISPRTPRYNLKLGKYIKKLEPLLFKSLGKLFGDTTVIKGFNAYQSAMKLRKKWDHFKNPVAIGLDASRFDQHVSVDALKFEHDIYMKCFPLKKHQRKLRRLLNMQLENHCVGYTPEGVVKYTIRGTRMSGDMNTSLGNCVLMCCMIKAYADFVGIELKLANNGDDCVVFMEKSDMNKFQEGVYEYFLGLGFNMKVEKPVFEFDQIEFCQTHPVYDGERWIMMRNPHVVPSKDSVFLQPYQSMGQVFNWMKTMSIGGLRMSGGLPVLQNFYMMFGRYGAQGRVIPKVWSWYHNKLINRMDRDFGPVSPEARLSVWLAYNLTPDEQVMLETEYDNTRLSFALL